MFLTRYKVKIDKLNKTLNNIMKRKKALVLDCTDAYMMIKMAPSSLKYLGADTSGKDPAENKNQHDRDKNLFGWTVVRPTCHISTR